MRKIAILLLIFLSLLFPAGCSDNTSTAQIAVTTAPIYTFTTHICQGTSLRIAKLISENVSCLHDYTLQTGQMQIVESADVVILSGAGLESFLDDTLHSANAVIDASENVPLLCGEATHANATSHHHSHDPHIWLSPSNGMIMAQNIYAGLCAQYPQYTDTFEANYHSLLNEFTKLDNYAQQELADLNCRQIITFHDGFSYLAEAYDLRILQAIEEESGSEASALELIQTIDLIRKNDLSCIFTETNGSKTAAQIIANETQAKIYQLDMAMGEMDYFEAMYHNVDTLKEALT